MHDDIWGPRTGKITSGAVPAVLGAIASIRSAVQRTPRSCAVGNSFVPGTLVVLADGSLVPIETLDTGDLLRTADPDTGETSAQAVLSHRLPAPGRSTLSTWSPTPAPGPRPRTTPSG